ncbi:SPOR domain-containing protein [Pararhizobium antarcticum]|uniref:SPOR domain-containing protein n=1 Tax=Pararhizobium antarcticum TaxID=1798805 RepID=UPI0015878FA4|nr:SPOR domain-containing protein [Pararhizobium antarcticum]
MADDDPLSELARIVGYDSRPAVQQLQEIEKQQRLVRREPVFDLEDELSREFELYDAPASVEAEPSRFSVDDTPSLEPRNDVEQAPALAPVDEPVFDRASSDEITVSEAGAEDSFEPTDAAPAASEFRALDDQLPVYEQPTVDDQIPVYEQVEHVAETVEPALFNEEPVAEINDSPEGLLVDQGVEQAGLAITAPEPAPVVDSWVPEPESEEVLADDGDFLAMDLERELEMSIGYDDVAVEPVGTLPVQSTVWDDAPLDPPSVEQHDTQPPEPAFDAIHQQQDVGVAADVEEQPAAPEEPTAHPFSMEHWDGTKAVVEAPAVVHDANSMDALLADIERFPVAAKAAALALPVSVSQPETVRKNNYPFTPTFSRATPTASSSGASSQKAFATPLAVAPVPLAVAPTIVASAPNDATDLPPEGFEPAVVTTAAQPVQSEPEPDFDLDNFEIDLSDIDLDLDPAEFVMETASFSTGEPAITNDPVFQEPVALSATPVVETQDAPYESDDVADFVLPFDPSMISETEESVTAISDLEVPHLPVVEQEKPGAYQPDYDLDIDAEIAQLFGNGAGKSAVRPEDRQDSQVFAAAAHSLAVTHAAAQPSNVRADTEFDEFEKAMEEDFRRSINQRQDSDPVNDRLAVGGDYGADDFQVADRSASGRRTGLMAAAVGGLLILGGVGAYAWMGGDGTSLNSSDPKIILADKSPVKMVPVEKGGKTVPNQDKAVYDRVAGAPAETLQQGTLVSSTEEPIDVVQRTLTPESLPLEGRDEFDGADITPIDGDDSARLLPDGEELQARADDEDRATAVSPRKVRTMIVKPDGTLVAREDPVAEPVTELASNETPVSANGVDPQVNTVKTTVVPAQTELETAAAPLTDLRPQEQPATEQSALAEAASATVDETAPVRTVRTTTVSEQAPVPQTRPAEQPVNVVGTVTDQGNVQPAPAATTTVAAAETTPVQTASVPAGSYVIQIASLPSEAEAQRSYTNLSGKFASVIGGRGSDIRKAEIAGKGTYYRVRIPAGSRDEANALCSRYKSAGGSCLVTR